MDEARLWTDGRYFLQAAQELSDQWKLMRIGEDLSVDIWMADVSFSSCIYTNFIILIERVGGALQCDGSSISFFSISVFASDFIHYTMYKLSCVFYCIRICQKKLQLAWILGVYQ